ncbi:DUF4065 domain-containing protein [Alkalihalobacillus oceani]|uniref:Panacea domain-containing protein n=1 Tax=Halalkalibacter oceani TaxID=1653776 RepID=UPI00203A3E89|nr:type II toxin-antitoxin system antitoxin SocA domain-containing protein [Halalkalibacter oceani]MCM3761021.1 DUF4065 domain-containing protein [Halalkalibacter oceani]
MGFIQYGDLSNYIIAYCNLNGTNITNKKLQKLMYYCQAWSLALDNERLIDHEFEAWVHGAVLKNLYFKYAKFGYTNIWRDPAENLETKTEFLRKYSDEKVARIHQVLEAYSMFSADELEEINHAEYPWQKTREGLAANENSDRPITDSLMREYYGAKALEKGMKKVKNNVFNFSSARLKAAQKKLKEKEVFQVNEDNYKEYEAFILSSYNDTIEATKRSEYGQNL